MTQNKDDEYVKETDVQELGIQLHDNLFRASGELYNKMIENVSELDKIELNFVDSFNRWNTYIKNIEDKAQNEVDGLFNDLNNT